MALIGQISYRISLVEIEPAKCSLSAEQIQGFHMQERKEGWILFRQLAELTSPGLTGFCVTPRHPNSHHRTPVPAPEPLMAIAASGDEMGTLKLRPELISLPSKARWQAAWSHFLVKSRGP